MIAISTKILEELGIELPETEQEKLLDHLQTTLDNRVGEEVVSFLSTEQLDEYMQLQETANLASQHAWLLKALPDLDEIVEDEYNILIGELADNPDRFALQSPGDS